MTDKSIVPMERIAHCIFQIRNQKVILDKDLSALYGVETKVFLQAVRRNIARFPQDFMFELSEAEFSNLRSQIVTSSWGGRAKNGGKNWKKNFFMTSSRTNGRG